MTVYPMKNPIILFYHDPLECLQSLMSNPLIKDFISFDLVCIFKTAAKLMRIYGEWLSGDTTWIMQVCGIAIARAFSNKYDLDSITTWCYAPWYHSLL
jgi:hypothetical protein